MCIRGRDFVHQGWGFCALGVGVLCIRGSGLICASGVRVFLLITLEVALV